MKDCKLTVEESAVSSVPHHRRLSSNASKLEAGLRTDKILTSQASLMTLAPGKKSKRSKKFRSIDSPVMV